MGNVDKNLGWFESLEEAPTECSEDMAPSLLTAEYLARLAEM